MVYYDPITCTHELDTEEKICLKCSKPFEFENGYGIPDQLINDLEEFKTRIHNRFAVILAIDGQYGGGKTTMGVQCANYLQKNIIDLKVQLA